MESQQYTTPQKMFDHHKSPIIKFFNKGNHLGGNGSTPGQNRLLHQAQQSTTPRALSNRVNYNIFPVIKTPPAKRFPKIVNPFEAALTDRLHLPIICSPSLFQRPATPQHSSTQFEWTIDEVSSLGPANVEPHETQFNNSPDPDVEAKAQAAISSYFKENQIVPSPLVECRMRNQRIALAEITGNTPIAKPGRRIRDGVAQTVLTLPPILPPAIEAALKPFFSYQENQQQSPSVKLSVSNSFIDHDARDASLRRKLFDFHNYHDDDADGDGEILEVTNCSSPPKSPDVATNTLNDSLNKSSFGSLSPISKLDSTSSPSKRKSSFLDMSAGAAGLSPICTNASASTNRLSYRVSKAPSDISCDLDNTQKSSPNKSLLLPTPDNFLIRRSSSPAFAGEMSIDSSFNGKISRLVVDSSQQENAAKKCKSIFDADVFDEEEEEDEMQISQMSQMSSKSSSSSVAAGHLNTPRSRRRTANRKNLSQSFSFHCSDEDDEDARTDAIGVRNPSTIASSDTGLTVPNNDTAGRSIFYRTDSGFNEMTSTQDESKFNDIRKQSLAQLLDESINAEDVSMISCSTPSKLRFAF